MGGMEEVIVREWQVNSTRDTASVAYSHVDDIQDSTSTDEKGVTIVTRQPGAR